MHTHAHKTQDQAGKSLAREPTHTQEAGSSYHQPMQSMDFHTLAYSSHQVAQPTQNGGNGMDPKNVFAQDGGTNNSKYKAFENRMRNALNLYDAKDKVTFVCYLAGSNIKQGVIADAGMDTASDISSDDDS
ncbi:hypothetical protein [Janthinobacterium lividum]|uniref:hypothetical protein n=2 Tax=Oxalobacteraceae TaxID=75682 RepID=UPI001B844880|nr:hypothetical protein [Janthinobacterium lividum]MBR7634244.1 hypothetical protein [Janthinobacterium lividum]